MLAAWQREGVGTALVPRCAGSMPGLYVIQTDPRGERRFLYWRDSAAARRLFALPDTGRIVAALAAFRLIYYSGVSLSLYGDAGRQRLAEALRAARAGGARIAFDTNFRPRGWPDRAVAQDAFRRAIAGADLVFASVEDVEPLFGRTGRANSPGPRRRPKRWSNCASPAASSGARRLRRFWSRPRRCPPWWTPRLPATVSLPPISPPGWQDWRRTPQRQRDTDSRGQWWPIAAPSFPATPCRRRRASDSQPEVIFLMCVFDLDHTVGRQSGTWRRCIHFLPPLPRLRDARPGLFFFHAGASHRGRGLSGRHGRRLAAIAARALPAARAAPARASAATGVPRPARRNAPSAP